MIDQFAEPGVYKRYALSNLPFENKTKFETKGESKSIAIAAASIISRYAFVKIWINYQSMQKLNYLKALAIK